MFTLFEQLVQLGNLLELDSVPDFDLLLNKFRDIYSLDIICPNGFGRSMVRLDTGIVRSRNILYPFEDLERFFGFFVEVPEARRLDDMNLFRIFPSSKFFRIFSKGLIVRLRGHAILYSKHDMMPIVRSLYTFEDPRLSNPSLMNVLYDEYGYSFSPNIGHTLYLPLKNKNATILPYPDTSYSTILAIVRSLNELLKRR